jgi:UPF0042 nucleotide-binding protein
MAANPATLRQTQHQPVDNPPVLIITGLSGSGKSTALRALEDVGYFCVDNLPLNLLRPFLAMQAGASQDGRKIALVMDVRTQGFLQNYDQVFRRLEKKGYKLHLIFLEADEETLNRRFSQTRRQHPLADHESIIQALREERQAMAGLRRLAHRIIDSSFYNPHQLRELIKEEFSALSPRQRMWLHLVSFAYKNGLPPEAEMVIDVRFLPNPFFVDSLTALTGNDAPVQDYVLDQPETQAFLEHLYSFVDYLLPHYQEEGKTHLTLAVGCTGGQHRSVVVANLLAEHLTKAHLPFTLNHRDMPRTSGDH